MKKNMNLPTFLISTTLLLLVLLTSSLIEAGKKDQMGAALQLTIVESYQDPIKGNLSTKMLGPAEIESNNLAWSLKTMCNTVKDLDKHTIEIFTDRRFYQDKKFDELLRNAPFLTDKVKANSREFKLLQDNFIASYNPDDGQLEIYPLKESRSKRISMGSDWCGKDYQF